jgi:hypothetical protein
MYKTSEMVYAPSYKWNAKADHDNPKIINGNEASELNREEGYEMLYLINSLGKTWKCSGYDKGAIMYVLMGELKIGLNRILNLFGILYKLLNQILFIKGIVCFY